MNEIAASNMIIASFFPISNSFQRLSLCSMIASPLILESFCLCKFHLTWIFKFLDYNLLNFYGDLYLLFKKFFNGFGEKLVNAIVCSFNFKLVKIFSNTGYFLIRIHMGRLALFQSAYFPSYSILGASSLPWVPSTTISVPGVACLCSTFNHLSVRKINF
jgi:hypothetical protein